MIRALGPQHGRRGRSPIAYVVRDNAGFVVGIDIGGTNIRAGAADVFGEPIGDEQQPTTRQGGRAVAAQVLEIAGRVAERASSTHERLLAIGVSTPGVVDQQSGIARLAFNVTADGMLDPLSAIGGRFGVPVLIDNNVNLAALGEKSFGLARGVSTMVFIGIGAGVGMGIIMDDDLVRGAHGGAGEIGYLPLVGDPFDPRHRLHGGLEDEVGAAGILAAFSAARAAGDPRGVLGPGGVRAGRAGRCRARARSSSTWRRGWGRRSPPCARSSIPSSWCWAAASARSPLLLSPVRGAAAALVPMTARVETSRLGDRAALQGAIAVALHAARTGSETGRRRSGPPPSPAGRRELTR